MPHRLRHTLPAALLALAAPFVRAQPPAPAPAPAPAPPNADPFVGSWLGVLRIPGGGTLRVTFAVRRDSAGALAGTLGSPDQTSEQIPGTFTARGDTLVASVPALGVTYTGVLAAARDSLRGTFVQGPGSLPLALGRAPAEASAPPRRPQDPRPPFPYRDEEVVVDSKPGVRLAGTLSLPPGRGPFPAVVFVSGSGPQNRDEELMGHRPFRVIADRLARAGVATLRYDDRGVARSTGAFAAATTSDFADDALAAVRYLRARPEIAAGRVGILGHSEGGAVGPLAASRSPDVAFVVMLAGPGVRGDSLLALQGLALARAAGAPAQAAATQGAAQRRIFGAVRGAPDSAAAAARLTATVDSLTAGVPPELRAAAVQRLAAVRATALSPWFRYFLAFDPGPVLRQVRVPVLALNGTLDLQVPAAENLRGVRLALEAGGNRDHQEVPMPGLNHLFQTARTGLPDEYPRIEETVAPAALDRITTWIVTRFAAAPAGR